MSQIVTSINGDTEKIIHGLTRFSEVYEISEFARNSGQKQSLEVFYKKSVLKNFSKFTGKHLSPAAFLKETLWYKCFHVNAKNFLRTPFLQNTSRRLLLSFVNWSSFLWFCLSILIEQYNSWKEWH